MNNKKKNNLFKIVIVIIIIIYENFFLIPAKKLLKYFKNYNLYNNILDFFSKNIFLNLLFLVLILIIAETSAIIAGFFLIKGLFILGILFYGVKIILFIPLVDLFKKNKVGLLKFKIIRVPYYYFLIFKRISFFYKIKEIKKNIKHKIKIYKKEIAMVYEKFKNKEIIK